MQRLKKYFCTAEITPKEQRTLGLEIETLFTSDNQPISLETSQAIMSELIKNFSWDKKAETNNIITNVEKGGFNIIYELGWNSFELISPPFLLSELGKLIAKYKQRLQELYSCARAYGAEPIFQPSDGFHNNTLIIPDKRDEIWLELDGPVLKELGHIASVHYNLSLESIEEGMKLIKKINNLYKILDIPPLSVRLAWQKYIKESRAGYEKNRYAPPPETFNAYCQNLSELKVVMNRSGGKLLRIKPTPFYQLNKVDIELFLRSVWWWTRLRKRNKKLVLEIRGFPRVTDKQIEKDLKIVLSLFN